MDALSSEGRPAGPPPGKGGDAGAVRSAVLALHRSTGLPMVFGGALTGRDRLRITELVGGRTGSLNGLVVRYGNGLGGRAMALGRPAWVSDYPRASTISHDYDGPVGREGLLSIVAVPIVVRRRVRGVLYGGLREPLGLADRVVGAAMQAARDIEQDLAVRDRAAEALTRLRPAPEESSAARWEEVRAVHAELRALAERVDDPVTRDRLREVTLRLAAAGMADGPDGRSPDGPARDEHAPGGRARAGHAPDGPVPRPVLSPRELDVLSYVAMGCTNAEVATRLGLVPETVKSYLRAAMRKLDAHTRLEAVTAARRAGLLP
ncbi:response regulator transcription factor [Actinomadura sp. LOL_016]|uniref:helix-turn-helix transcriptional regulator n=1 Tax=unclassified Actinomadura TaxID=2626254 RepID=UPI003A804A41